ncbi:hypothetical protein EWM64_g9043, partial [Hericium alpestre]
MITDSASLQHKIELAVSGVGQAPPKTSQTCELSKRTEILRDHRAVWRNLVWHEFCTVPAAPLRDLDPDSLFRYTNTMSFHRYPDSPSQVLLRENVLAQKGWEDSNIYLTRIPSRRLATTEWEMWTVSEDLGCGRFTMDPSQDLLVRMESLASISFTESGITEAAVHLRSLTTGAAHPLADNSTFYVSFNPPPQREMRCEGQIVGDHLGVFYSDDKTDGFKKTVIIWDWKTGDKILEIVSTSFFSFSFIDEIHVLIASHYHYMEENVWEDGNVCASVWVYDLTNHTSSRTHLTDGTYRCAFFLPLSYWVDTIYVRCNPSSLHQSVLSYSCIEDLPDSIVTICEFCQVEEDSQLEETDDDEIDAEAVVQVFVPASRLRARISLATPGQRFAWGEWGPTDAFIQLNARPTDMEARIDSVYGMRAVDHDTDFTELCVYDFELLRISNYYATDAEASESSEGNEIGECPGPQLRLWGHRVEEMFASDEEGEHDWSNELLNLSSSVELPQELWGLDWQSYNSLITDDAVVILNV